MRNGRKNRESCLHEKANFLDFINRSNIEMQRKRNRDGALNNYILAKIFVTIHSAESNLLL